MNNVIDFFQFREERDWDSFNIRIKEIMIANGVPITSRNVMTIMLLTMDKVNGEYDVELFRSHLPEDSQTKLMDMPTINKIVEILAKEWNNEDIYTHRE